MNKAFIFDMDGVIVNSEPVWERYEKKFLPELMGRDTYFKIKDQILGNSISRIYDVAANYGFKMNKNNFVKIYHQYAEIVYREAKITDGTQELIDKLISMNFKLGLVSVSRCDWIDLVLSKLEKNAFQFVLSIDSAGLRPKPFPDGYIKAMQNLKSSPNLTIILEDSQRGIKAAKASGALTICLQEHLPKGYLPKGADIYTKSITELINKIDFI
jgi:HAD superfamily hydrolase (TIGR01509 family)